MRAGQPPWPPHCCIPVRRPQRDLGPREGAACCSLRSCPDLGLDSKELGESHPVP